MSSKSLTNAVQTALDLCRDAYGNGLSGQDERSLRYIALAVEQLTCVIQVLEDKNDSRKSIEMERLTRSLRTDTHPAYRSFPEIDDTVVADARAHWLLRDMPDNVLRALNIDSLPPELQAVIARGKQAGGPIVLPLTAEQAKSLVDK